MADPVDIVNPGSGKLRRNLQNYRKHQYSGPKVGKKRALPQLKRRYGDDIREEEIWCTEEDIKPNVMECDVLDVSKTVTNPEPVTYEYVEDVTIKSEPEESPSKTVGLCCCCLELLCPKSLWGTYKWMGHSEIYGHMLQECFGITFPKQENSTSEQICEVCINRLRNANKFRRQVMTSQKKLYNQLIAGTSAKGSVDVPENPVTNPIAEIDCKSFVFDTTQISKSEEQIDYDINNDDHSDDINEEPVTVTIADEETAETKKTSPTVKKNQRKRTRTATGARGAKKSKQIVILKGVPKPTDKKAAEVEIDENFVVKKVSSKADANAAPKPGPSGKKKYRTSMAELKLQHRKTRLNAGLLLEHSTLCPFKSKRSLFYCFYCNKPHLGFEELRSHVDNIHGRIAFDAIIKCIDYPTKKIKVDVTNIMCKICSDALGNVEDLVKHLTEKHDVKFDYEDGKPEEYVLGYELANGKLRCSVCKKEFKFFRTLTTHMNEHSSECVCETCGRRFLCTQRLAIHRLTHEEREPAKCDICDKTYLSKLHLKHHMRYFHKNKPHLCSVCGEGFPTYRRKLNHLIEAHGRAKLDLKCKLCSKEFSSPSCLNTHHKNAHLKIPKEAKFGCKECGRMFTTGAMLRGHGLVHSGEKNHECHFCQKKFARPKNLREHLKIHNNDKRWACAACSQAFVQKCSLRNHIRVHHVDADVEELIVYKKPEPETDGL